MDDTAVQKLGVPYPVLVAPNVERMPLATIRKLQDYAAKGGIVLATKRAPSMAPGLSEENDTPEVARISKALFDAKRIVMDETALGTRLAASIQPDFAVESHKEAIGFIHRKLDSADVYFIANTSNQPVHTLAKLRLKGVPGEWWDPFTLQVSGIQATSGKIALDLEPYESRVLVLSRESTAKPLTPLTGAGEIIDLTANWQVFFGGLDYEPKIQTPKSWVEDAKTKYFSGKASYEKTIEISGSMLGKGKRVFLDFGPGKPLEPKRMANGMRAWLDPPVREAAFVEVNGTNIGAVWHPPFQIDVTKAIKPGRNNFNIIVANTAINGLAGTTLPDYKLLNLRHGNRFQPQDMENLQPLPSGILGKVRLISR